MYVCKFTDKHKAVELLCEYAKELNPVDGDQQTPLLIAAQHNMDEIVSFLLKKGCMVDARAKSQETSLHWAGRYFYYSFVILKCDSIPWLYQNVQRVAAAWSRC